jgi:thioredoxin-like negative regulator of GroEL
MSNTINENQYNEITQQGNVVVQFTADWCGPCRNIKPIIEKASNTFGFDYKTVNIEKERLLSESKQIKSIPFVEIYKGGNLVHSFVGQKSPSQLNEIFETFYQ